jgi:small-conductance mechanosensitive channel
MKNYNRAIIEIGFIIFLFYSNLLMGEFTRSNMSKHLNVWGALRNIFTGANFLIAIVAAFIGYFMFEFLRKNF